MGTCPAIFELDVGYDLGAPTREADGRYDANATPMDAGAATRPARRFEGDTYIAAMGRFSDLPPTVATLANKAVRAGRNVTLEALFDDDKQYVGYRVWIERRDGNYTSIDVTGAASRFVDAKQLPGKQATRVKRAEGNDAPQESGNFAGGYAPSATQSARYRAYRKKRPGDFQQGEHVDHDEPDEHDEHAGARSP